MTATVAVVMLALLWLAPWTKPLSWRWPFGNAGSSPAGSTLATSESAPPPQPSQQASVAVSSPAPVPAAPAPAATPAQPAPVTQATPPVGAAPASKLASAMAPGASVSGPAVSGPANNAASSAQAGPSFDIVRVEPTGETVVAGRAEPGSEVTLMDGEGVVGRVTADPSGQFALVPDALKPGSHYLTLQTRKKDGKPTGSAQGVAVSVAPTTATKPLVALLAPDKPAQVLSDGSAIEPAAKAATAAAPAKAVPVSIQTVEARQGGKFTAGGVARPGSQCRVYLNGAYLADVQAGPDGRWSVDIEKGMKPGHYTVRADELEAGTGKVAHRAEVPFDYPVAMAVTGSPATAKETQSGAKPAAPAAAPPQLAVAANPQGSGAAGGVATASAVIPDLQSATVIRGDSLWRISRKMLGHGIKYTEIYASNTGQIRDPSLIYPGQIFVVPNRKPD